VVSIIIPLYNKAAYIEKAIRSVFNQTFKKFELIIVNDGSTDQGLEVVTNLLTTLSRQTVVCSWKVIDQINEGVSKARNKGVKEANYNYIAFLDADDWWEPTYLEEMNILITEFPEAGIYGSSYFKVKNGHNIIASIGVEYGFKKGLINYCQVYSKTMYQPIWTGATIIKKLVFESEHGFKSTLKLGEDFDLWVRVSLKYPVAFLNKPLAYYNQDVEPTNRAIGEKLYEPNEHMLFSDYGDLMKNIDFRNLFEVLAVYGLLPYYLSGKNKKEVDIILSKIEWINHPFKYRLYYNVLPKQLFKLWVLFQKFAYHLKSAIISNKSAY